MERRGRVGKREEGGRREGGKEGGGRVSKREEGGRREGGGRVSKREMSLGVNHRKFFKKSPSSSWS